jgi:carbon storage regulator CsrA
MKMLVLSRKENESIVFPKLGISVQVTRLGGRVVKLGIEAPEDVRVYRGELVQDSQPQQECSSPAPRPKTVEPKLEKSKADSQRESMHRARHELRNRLNSALLGLQVLQTQIEKGRVDDMEGTLFQIFQRLTDLNTDIDSAFQATQKSLENAAADRQASTEKKPLALIVDDSQNEALLLAQYLELNGYSVQVVQNGKEAIGWLQNNEHPDVVLMDMNMPEMDGPETIHHIRNNSHLNSIRLFGVSGMDQEEAGVAMGEHGVDRWFSKPVDARKLIKELNGSAVANIA